MNIAYSGRQTITCAYQCTINMHSRWAISIKETIVSSEHLHNLPVVKCAKKLVEIIYVNCRDFSVVSLVFLIMLVNEIFY